MNQPKVSVIMGIYNCEKTLPEAIDSILAQTYTNWELIMCDDGSTDGTYQVADEYRKKYPEKIILLRNQENKKLSYTLNRCLEVATGELIARMDGDDISHRDRLRQEVAFLQMNQEYRVVGTAMQCFDESGMHNIMHPVLRPNRLTQKTRSPFYHATIVMYKSVFSTLNGYSEEKCAERAEDVDLWFRFFYHGFSGANIDAPLYYVREDYNSLKRRTILNRINSFRTVAHGARLLSYPRIWVFKQAIMTFVKCLVPFWAVKWIRNNRKNGARN